MERFGCRPVKPNHLKSYNRTPAALLWTRFPAGHANCANLLPITFSICGLFSYTRLPLKFVAVSSDKPNIARARRQDSNTTSARSVARKRSRDVRLPAHVCWRADLG